jgi:alkanesulfonate monooxygenase SsuD/methylene tetrahydromethanopterin reductase-like flavin-dependent oxidoreductase (luciferase family)/predicted kinase
MSSMELRLPAPSLVVLIGPSSAGKSTWSAQHFAPNEVVSSDSLRAVVGAGEDDQTASATAFEILERIVDERLRRRLTTVIDTLGYDDEARASWVGKAHAMEIPAHAIVFATPAEVCETRNRAKAKPIPVAALRRQVARLPEVLATLPNDGFDGVHDVQPVAMVAPVVADAAARTVPARPAAHTFGLLVSRFDWDGELGPNLADIARRAEGAGFRDIWVMDHFRQIRGVGRPWEDMPEAYTSLAFMAGVTESIRLGCLVTGITHRHPIVLGKMIATLDVLSGGRAICGLGLAWDREEHEAYDIELPEPGDRYALLEETLEMLPLLWGKGSPEFHGSHIVSPGLVCYPRPIQTHIPIVIGGSGEKRTLRLVARYADGCNVFGDPERVRHKVGVLERHCADLERDPADIEVTHLTNVVAAPDRQALRETVERLRDRNASTEETMRRWNAGTVDDLQELFSAYDEAGADHSIVALPHVAQPGSIESFADVISRFASP